MWECKSTNVKLSKAIKLLYRGLRKSSALCVPIAPVSLAALLGLAGANWLVQTAIAPQIAQAYTARVDVALNREEAESYETLLRRAEALARAAAQRSFDQDILVTEVAVTVLVQSEGTIAPVLSLEATRQGWSDTPDPKRWAKYYPTAQTLLQLEETTGSPSTQQEIPSYPNQPPSTITPPPTPPATPGSSQIPSPSNTAPVPAQPGTTPNNQTPGTSDIPGAPGNPINPAQPQVVPLPTQPNP